MRLDVIHVGCVGADAAPRTFAAKPLTHELRRAQILAPNVKLIPCVPCCCIGTSAGLVAGLMLGAVNLPRQRAASGVSTRAERT